MNSDNYILTIMIGDRAITSALVKNDTPLPMPGDSFSYRNDAQNFITQKVLSRTFSLLRDENGPSVGVVVHLSEGSL
ncbi:MAG TPA: hypothetical protein VGU23_08505 [Acidobacteriaceae bacterium]|nr:hypothetical protein [Acidobacteriaceae bacterium]